MLDFVIAIISFGTSIFLGLLMLLNNRKSGTNVYFALLIFCNGFYTLFNYLVLNSSSNEDAFFWTKLVMTAAIPVGPSFYFFVKAFPNKRLIFNGLMQSLLAIWMATNILLVYAGLIFSSVSLKNGSLELHPGPLIASFGLMQVTTLATASWVLVRKYQQSTGKLKLQLKYITYGILISFGLTLLSTVVLPLVFKITFFISVSPLFLLIAEAAISYSIVRHRLLDFRLVVARSVAYTLLIAILGLFYSGIVFGISSLFFQNEVALKEGTIYFIIALFIALTFNPLRKIIEKVTDKIFFKNRYDSSELLANISSITNKTIELNFLTSQILVTLLRQMKISRGAFVLLEANSIYQIISLGFTPQLELNYYQMRPFLTKTDLVVFEELEEGDLKKIMRDLNISVVKILEVKDKIVGLLLLGEKSSGEIYSDQDLKIIQILAPEAAVAIQNSQSIDKIKRFNVTLTQEVEKATKDLQIANAKLKQLDKLKDDFVSIASHELRTPMTAIRSYSWMALNRSDVPLSEKLKRYLGRTLLSTERLIDLVNDMLNISRIESGRIEISPKSFDIGALVGDVFGEVEVKAREKNIHLHLERYKLPLVFADPDKVHQVLLNLIGNALKFTKENGNISILFFADGQTLEVGVKDDGVGISKDEQPQLFSKFGRLDNSYVAAATSGGTGLGLYISKSLIELMHGKIWVVSEGVGTGTTFIFSLPIATKQVIQRSDKFAYKPQGEIKALEPVAI